MILLLACTAPKDESGLDTQSNQDTVETVAEPWQCPNASPERILGTIESPQLTEIFK